MEQEKFSSLMLRIKRNLRRERVISHHSIEHLSDIIKMPVSQLKRIEDTGKSGCHVSVEALARITAFYGVTIDELIGSITDNCRSNYFRRPKEKSGGS